MIDFENKFAELRDQAIDESLILEIVILNTTKPDWELFFSLVRGLEYQFFRGGSEKNLPEISEDLFQETDMKLLKIMFSNSALECLFYSIDEIEINCIPKQFRNSQDIQELKSFVKSLKSKLSKNVLMRVEGGLTGHEF